MYWIFPYLCIRNELFDSIAPQNAENRTVANSLLLFLKCSVKCLFLKWLCQTVENLKYTLTYPTNEREQNVSGKMYIQFYDKDGFVLAEMKISSLNYVTKHDENGEVTYLTANGSSGYLDINDYKAISSYSIITY